MTKILMLVIAALSVPLVAKDCERKISDNSSAASLLAAMDYDLSQIERGNAPCGSFSDYFAVSAYYAIKAGASRQSVDLRVARLIALAEKKIYLSSYEEGLDKDGGTAAIKGYMHRIIQDAVLETVKDSPKVPTWVQAELTKMKGGRSVDCKGSTFGCGSGVYRLTEGRETPFFWYSYSNSDGWEQIALTTKIFEYDRRAIQSLRDQLGRLGIYDSWSSQDMTWIGLTNDLWCRDDLKERYVRIAKWTNLPGGGKVGEYAYHRNELRRDYLDRLTAATGGHLRFH